MLFIFRKLRKSFFLPGKVRTYVAYAIGEIALIMVGILLALQVSEWNQERRDAVEETEILNGLKREFTGYHQHLKYSLNNHAKMMSAMLAILKSMDTGSWFSEDWTIDEAIDQLLSPPTSDLGNGVRDALIQGGRMEIISNRALREQIANWPKYFEELKDDQDMSRNIVLHHLIPYFIAHGIDLSTTVKNWGGELPGKLQPIARDSKVLAQLLDDQEFKSMVQVRYAFWGHARGEYDRAIMAAEEILDLIDAELTSTP
jgi:hypothetical protein